VVGLDENELHRRAQAVIGAEGALCFGIFAAARQGELVLEVEAVDTQEARDELTNFLENLRTVLGDHLIDLSFPSDAEIEGGKTERSGEDVLVRVLCALLREREADLGVAESCTGGMLAARLTGFPGVSDVFQGAVVAYANAQKEVLLGVPEQRIASCGAVSSTVAQAMAAGCRDRLAVDLALATTGIAGPGGGTQDKPVGLVFIAVCDRTRSRVCRHLFTGDRQQIRDSAATAALDEARRFLLDLPALGQDTGA